MSHIKSILFPDSITTIREYAFAGTGIEKINIPPKVTHIYEYTFEGCASLTEVYIPKSVTQIDSMAFRNCTSLTKVVFEDPTGWEISGYAHEDDVFADPEKAAELLRTDAWRYTWMKK